jgi:hypothetical protein
MNRFISIARGLIAGVMLVFCGLLAGCTTVATPGDLVRGSGYQPENVFGSTNALPANIRRVVVLPLVCDENDFELAEGRAALEPILLNELIKTKKFEIVSSDAQVLKNRINRAEFAGEEALPPELFALLRQSSACDAVLFARLTIFRPYPPLTVGWRLRLVDAQTRRTIWAADEVFNSGQRTVENGARRHQLTDGRDPDGAPDEWFIQNSPTKFGEYTAARLLATLPAR